MIVRPAEEQELERVNVLRKQVNDLHVEGKPNVFKANFYDGLSGYVYEIWNDDKKEIIVAINEGEIVGYAVLAHINRTETPFMYERDYLDIVEIGVDKDYRRHGVASEMISYILDYAKDKGFKRVELNMWEFNQGALEFYEKVGFKTYRRCMEIEV